MWSGSRRFLPSSSPEGGTKKGKPFFLAETQRPQRKKDSGDRNRDPGNYKRLGSREAPHAGLTNAGDQAPEDRKHEASPKARWRELRKEAGTKLGLARPDNSEEGWKHCLESQIPKLKA